jgi:hypothetical protein
MKLCVSVIVMYCERYKILELEYGDRHKRRCGGTKGKL